MAKADRLLRDAELELSGAAEEARRKLADQGRAAEEAAAKTELLKAATKGAGGGVSALASPMGLLVGAGVALSPVLVTVGFGLAGLAAAAYKSVSPILEAGNATKKSRAELERLDPAQRAAYQSLTALKGEFGAFSKALEPQVLGLFNEGLKIAGGLLKDVEPVAAATGKALEGVLGSVSAEFRSGTWQNFFSFMARTAAPDTQLLGKLLVDLLADIPPLLEQLQPLAKGLLYVADGALKVIGALERWKLALPLLGAAIGAVVAGPIGALTGALAGTVVEFVGLGQVSQSLSDKLKPLPSHVQLAAAATIDWGAVTKTAKEQLKDTATNSGVMGDAAATAAPKIGTLAGDMAILSQKVQSGNLQLAAFNDLWNLIIGNSLNAQQAILADKSAFEGLVSSIKSSGVRSTASQSAFVSYIQQIGTSIGTLQKSGASVSAINDEYKTNIARLLSLHNLTPTQRSDIAALIREYDAWATSTAGLSGNVKTAAGLIGNQYIAALQGAHHWTPQVSSDVSGFASSILKTGDASQSTKHARDVLIADLEKAGLSANDAKAYANAFQKQIDALHGKNVNVGLTTSGSGQIIISGTGINQRVINTTTGQVRGPGGHTLAAGGIITGGVPGRDSVPIMAMPGEVVVPTSMVRAGAVDHLRGRLPGFAAGGVVGKVAGAEGSVGLAEAQWGQLAAQAFASAAVSAARKAAQAAAAALTGGAGNIGIGRLSASSGYQAFQRVAANLGWGPGLLQDWVNVEMREAGFSLTATNPSSGAYGMAQFINGPGEYYQYGGNPFSYIGQAVAMANYIRQRYGNPAGAWAHEVAFNWYGNGLDAVFRKPTVIGVGERGAERVQVTPAGRGGGGGGSVTIVIENHGVIGSQAEMDKWLNDGIDRLARNGKLTYALRRSPSAA